MRSISEIIIHCSATRSDWMDGRKTSEKVAEIKRWHTDPKSKGGRGWRDIGYHFLIDRDGTIAPGRPVEQSGAHTLGHNTGTIGVCLLGGHGSSENDGFEKNFTAEQDSALRKFLADQKARFPSIGKISGHNEYAAKACPGFQVAEWFSMGVSTSRVSRDKTDLDLDNFLEIAGAFKGRDQSDVLAEIVKLFVRKKSDSEGSSENFARLVRRLDEKEQVPTLSAAKITRGFDGEVPLTPVNAALGETVGKALNGKKSVSGIVGLLLTAAIPQLGLQGDIVSMVQDNASSLLTVFSLLTGWGFLGKIDKAIRLVGMLQTEK